VEVCFKWLSRFPVPNLAYGNRFSGKGKGERC
jgi:hypothetical protein